MLHQTPLRGTCKEKHCKRPPGSMGRVERGVRRRGGRGRGRGDVCGGGGCARAAPRGRTWPHELLPVECTSPDFARNRENPLPPDTCTPPAQGRPRAGQAETGWEHTHAMCGRTRGGPSAVGGCRHPPRSLGSTAPPAPAAPFRRRVARSATCAARPPRGASARPCKARGPAPCRKQTGVRRNAPRTSPLRPTGARCERGAGQVEAVVDGGG
jgi:hypothetical protein